LSCRILLRPEGRLANRRKREDRMRWTWKARGRSVQAADGEIVRSWSPDAGIKPCASIARKATEA